VAIMIQKVQEITFDCNAERQRILAAFENGTLQTTLLNVVNKFEQGDLQGIIEETKDFTIHDFEYLHWTITDILFDFAKQKPDATYIFMGNKT
jgi:hypothetical protein